MAKHILVTGANRGIGLGFVRAYLTKGDSVTAACRNPERAAELHSLADESGRLHILPLDLAKQESINHLVEEIAPLPPLDIVIQNAGIPHSGVWEQSENWGTLTAEGLLHVLHINAVAPLILSQSLLPQMKANGVLAVVSSYFGSVGGEKQDWMFNNFGYSASKAALNLWMRNLGALLRERQIHTVALDPGWVQTDMGGGNADLTVAQSVGGMVTVIGNLSEQSSGKFISWNGSKSPW